jgi:hypothetical protein
MSLVSGCSIIDNRIRKFRSHHRSGMQLAELAARQQKSDNTGEDK